MVLALTLAIIVWAVATNEENPSVQRGFPESIPIEVLNKPENMIVLGNVTDRVRLIVQAPQSSWNNLSSSSFQAWVDLKGLSADIHDVKVRVKCSDRAVKIVGWQPTQITIRLEEAKEKELEITPNVMDEPPLGHIYRTPSVVPDKARVSGPVSAVDQVTMVAADVYLRGAKTDVEKWVTLVARNAQGETVGEVGIEPPKAKVQVSIEQRVGYKDVSVRVILKGQVASGYRISNVSVDPSIVTVVGRPWDIANIPGYLATMPIDVEGADADVVARVPLALPEGVSLLGEQQSIVVTVSVTALESGLTMRRRLTIEGLALGLKATPSPAAVDVILAGPMPQIDALKPGDVQVILDLSGLDVGVHKVNPRVVAPQGIRAESILPETVEVHITSIPTPTSTPTSTAMFTDTPTLTATPADKPTSTFTSTSTSIATLTLAAMPTDTPTPESTPQVPGTLRSGE